MTGQDYFALLEAPPFLVSALRDAWNARAQENETRQRVARGR